MSGAVSTSAFAGPKRAAAIDHLGSQLSDADALQEDMILAITQQDGVLWWAPTATLSVTDLLQRGLSDADVLAIQSRIEEIFADDPQYDVVRCAVDLTGGKLTIRLAAQSTRGVIAELRASVDGDELTFERVV